MSWNIAQAKQHFSDVVKQAAEEPQLIYNRDRLVAAVINAENFNAFQKWRDRTSQPTLAEKFAELRQLMWEENYELEIPLRTNRPNIFIPRNLPGIKRDYTTALLPPTFSRKSPCLNRATPTV